MDKDVRLSVDPASLSRDPTVLVPLVTQLLDELVKRDRRIEDLEHRMDLLLRRIYGRTSEKLLSSGRRSFVIALELLGSEPERVGDSSGIRPPIDPRFEHRRGDVVRGIFEERLDAFVELRVGKRAASPDRPLRDAVEDVEHGARVARPFRRVLFEKLEPELVQLVGRGNALASGDATRGPRLAPDSVQLPPGSVQFPPESVKLAPDLDPHETPSV